MSKPAHLRRDPRDFTGGGIFGLPGTPGTTGDPVFDERIKDLVDDWACGRANGLVREMIVTALKMGRDCGSSLRMLPRKLKAKSGKARSTSCMSICMTTRQQPQSWTALSFIKTAEPCWPTMAP